MSDPQHHPSPLGMVPFQPVASFLDSLNAEMADTLRACGQAAGFVPNDMNGADPELPYHWRWAACYAVRGDLDGYWVHIDLQIFDAKIPDWHGLTPRRRVQNLAMMKVWSWEHALKIANAATLAISW